MTKSNKSLPRGRRRLGWKTEFLDALGDAAVDLGDLTEKEAVQSVRSQRSAGESIGGLKSASESRSGKCSYALCSKLCCRFELGRLFENL